MNIQEENPISFTSDGSDLSRYVAKGKKQQIGKKNFFIGTLSKTEKIE